MIVSNGTTADTVTNIITINPQNGCVLSLIDASSIVKIEGDKYNDVLNGIAYDFAHQSLYLTGKNWKNIYQVRIINK